MFDHALLSLADGYRSSLEKPRGCPFDLPPSFVGWSPSSGAEAPSFAESDDGCANSANVVKQITHTTHTHTHGRCCFDIVHGGRQGNWTSAGCALVPCTVLRTRSANQTKATRQKKSKKRAQNWLRTLPEYICSCSYPGDRIYICSRVMAVPLQYCVLL